VVFIIYVACITVAEILKTRWSTVL